jgi:hypothetical protein
MPLGAPFLVDAAQIQLLATIGRKCHALPVKLSEVIDGLEMADDNFQSYINRNTGEVASVSDEEAGWVEEEEERGRIGPTGRCKPSPTRDASSTRTSSYAYPPSSTFTSGR